MGAITPIDFENGLIAPIEFRWKQVLKGNLQPSIEICNTLTGILHPSIEIPNNALGVLSNMDASAPLHLKDVGVNTITFFGIAFSEKPDSF